MRSHPSGSAISWRIIGGKIDAIAKAAFCYAMAESSPILAMNYLQQAWQAHRHH
jgi:hypothetical protein